MFVVFFQRHSGVAAVRERTMDERTAPMNPSLNVGAIRVATMVGGIDRHSKNRLALLYSKTNSLLCVLLFGRFLEHRTFRPRLTSSCSTFPTTVLTPAMPRNSKVYSYP